MAKALFTPLEILRLHALHSDFHADLLLFYTKRGFLTDKQWKYVESCRACVEAARLLDGSELDIDWELPTRW